MINSLCLFSCSVYKPTDKYKDIFIRNELTFLTASKLSFLTDLLKTLFFVFNRLHPILKITYFLILRTYFIIYSFWPSIDFFRQQFY